MAIQVGEGHGIGLASLVGTKDTLIEKATKQDELNLKECEDKIEIKSNQLGDIADLQAILNNIKTKASALTSTSRVGFDSKTSEVISTDTGVGKDYITNITVDDTCPNSDVKVAVKQVAAIAEANIGLAPNVGFAKDVDLGIDATLKIILNGIDRDIVVVPGDKLVDVLKKIENEFISQNDKFEASIVNGNNNEAYISIRAKETGYATISIDEWINNGALGFNEQSTQNGQNAIININGLEKQQASNKFVDAINGLSFELAGKPNNANADPMFASYGNLNYNTIQISEDHTAVREMIADFIKSLNKLPFFIAKHEKSNRSIEADRFSNFNELLKSYNDPDATLYGSSLIKEAKQIWERFTSSKNGAEDDINSLKEIGIDLVPSTKEFKGHDDKNKIINYQELDYVDKNLFTKQYNNNYDKVIKFFRTDIEITSDPVNRSRFIFLRGEHDKPINDSSIVGRDINIQATYDVGGVLTDFTANVNGSLINAAIELNSSGSYNIKFPADSRLSNLEFSVTANAANGVENFVINYTPGMANLIQDDAREMFSDDALSGTTVIEFNIIQDEIKGYEAESVKITAELNNMIQKISNEHQTIMNLDMMFKIQFMAIEAAFGLDSN